MNYRREIDGLRALAVLPVILFHAGFETFSGGFVGVDVFFVISGYLITTIILSELEQGQFSIANFYERRARRILPALFFVMLVSIPFAWFWLFPSDMKDFSESLIAVSLFASNILFWSESGYFDTEAELKPLLHTWSLAVEEQYYVLFPLFLMLFWTLGKRWVLVILGFVFVASLALAQWGAVAKSAAAFYLLPTRGWELLIGAFAAFYLSQADREEFSKGLRELGGWLGVALIVYAVFAYSKATPFPGFYALVPTSGAVLIILFATQDTSAGRFVGNQAFVGIGLISYSAYLWHQPLFAFARHGSLTEPNHQVYILLIILTFLLAYGSWKFVETPFRRKELYDRKKVVVFGVFGTATFVFIGILGHGLNGFEDYYFKYRVALSDRVIASYIKYNDSAEFKRGYRYGTCFYGSQLNSFRHFNKDECLSISANRNNYLVLGDSHSAHLVEGFRSNFPHQNFLQASASGCKPVLPIKGEKRCTDLIKYIYNEFLTKYNLDGIILSARWKNDDITPLKETVEFLSKLVPNIYVVGPTVEYKLALPMLMVKLKEDSRESAKIRKFVDETRFATSDAIGRALKSSGAVYVPIAREICSKSSCRVMTDSGVPLSWDYGHFTLEGADHLIKRLIEKETFKLPSL